MSDRTARADWVPAYEALRAQVTGQLPPTTPRGLALFLRAGMAAWMATAASGRPAAAPPTPAAAAAPSLAGAGPDLVRLLTEMALGGLRRGAA